MWYRLSRCENDKSDDSANGKYHGWFQFLQSTWNSVARRHGAHHLVGRDPHTFSYETQKRVAIWNWKDNGRRWSGQWPGCSRKLGLR